MKILIDCDACPVYKLAIMVAKEYKLDVHLFFDPSHQIQTDYAICHLCDQGNDSVDYELLKNILEDDICITQDYGLASLALAKKAIVINQNGMIYDENNIDTLLDMRYLGAKIRKENKHIKGPKKRTVENDEDFLYSLQKIISDKLNYRQ